MIKTNISIFLSIVIFSGCVSLEPKLEPLDSKVIPKEWKTNIENNSNDLALIKTSWEDFVKDETLKKVVSKAIENNKDLKIALLNIEAARATYRISRADLFPNITGNMDISHSKSLNSSNNSTISHNYNANIAASYELDLFGKIKSLNENALNSYLSTQFATNATKISLISETINAWIILASNMEQLELAKQTATNLQKVYELTQKRFTAGVVSKNDVYDANASLKESELNVISYSKKVEENKNALELLIAEPLKEDFLPKDFESYKNSLMIVKSGVSSNILLSRPDIMEAEYNLKAKNANIGAARAAFFPSISLTASSGLASRSLSSLFDGGAKSIWSFSPNISIPIFNAGENQANLDYSYTQKDIALLEYEKSIQTAFKEVSDTLITRATIKEQIQKQKELVDSVSKSYDISLNSYKIGVGSYLNVLIAQRTLISSQQALINTYLEDLTNRVSLYSVFGGNEKVE
ncbi:MAG: efflux transporter outer membrane subunit [Arcobacter sp.]|uniref:efflux transporter outer membrane subunit n=1 Tax=Arcobacter sp. TaxID=1872629 RepID=UPI002A7493E3|nr:efflux transporter outer membrane subunit [Arcobacter sp.]MDY3200093.1 efflux transporter outer membrane subunit [Arcobacter sp.]